MCRSTRCLLAVALLAQIASARLSSRASTPATQGEASTPVGIFEGHGDVGTVLHSGSVAYDPATRSYVTGSGENMWSTSDALHFAWKRVSGNVSVTADVVIPARIEAPHWLPDGETLVCNSRGRSYRVPVAGGKPAVVETGVATGIPNDHGVAPDGACTYFNPTGPGAGRSGGGGGTGATGSA